MVALALGFAGTWWLLRAPVKDVPAREASAPPMPHPLEDPRATFAPTPAGAGDQAAAQLDAGANAPGDAKAGGRGEAPRENLSDTDRRGLEDVLRRAGSPPEPGSR
jgi:hypothetical protein